MALITGERSGVFIDHDSSMVISGDLGGGNAVLVADFDSAVEMKIFHTVGAVSADRELPGNSEVSQAVKALLSGDISAVYLLPSRGDFEAALEKAAELENVRYIVLASADSGAHTSFAKLLYSLADRQRECIGFSFAEGADAAVASATAANCERLMLTHSGGTLAAAALAASVSRVQMSDPLYNLPLECDATVSTLSEDELDRLIRNGVTVLESVGGKLYAIRVVTTRSHTDGVPDRSLLDLQVVRIRDHVLSNVRLILSQMLGNLRSNPQSRLAISTQVSLVMEDMVAAGLLSQYEPPEISEDENDSSVCNVLLSFTVAKGFCRIVISANISV